MGLAKTGFTAPDTGVAGGYANIQNVSNLPLTTNQPNFRIEFSICWYKDYDARKAGKLPFCYLPAYIDNTMYDGKTVIWDKSNIIKSLYDGLKTQDGWKTTDGVSDILEAGQ